MNFVRERILRYVYGINLLCTALKKSALVQSSKNTITAHISKLKSISKYQSLKYYASLWSRWNIIHYSLLAVIEDGKLWKTKMAVSKCPCLTFIAAMSCLDARISLVPEHQLIVPLIGPCNTHPNTQGHKSTKPQRYIRSQQWHMSYFFKIAKKNPAYWRVSFHFVTLMSPVLFLYSSLKLLQILNKLQYNSSQKRNW